MTRGEALSLEDFLARWSQSHGGYEPAGLVRGWLGLSYRSARPLAAVGVPADLVTAAGVVLGGAAVAVSMLGGNWVAGAAVLVGLSAVCDGVDGGLAVLTRRAGPWGAVLDSVADRVADALLLLALWVVGAPAWAAVLAGALAFLLEYARARAGAVGVGDIAVVTVGERPARVAVAAMFLLAAGVLPAYAATWAAAGAYLSALLAAVGLVQLTVVLRRRLR